MINLNDHNKKQNNIFSIEESKTRPYKEDDLVHLSVSYELDLNMYSISREVYNALDMLGDIGALQYALFLIFSFLLTILNFHHMENYLVSQMFQVID